METVLAVLTAPGKAAIATLCVRGPMAWTITRRLFKPHKGVLPDEPGAGRHWFGKLGKDHADEVIVAVKSGLPTPCIEVHCHGGVEVVRMIQELYAEQRVSIITVAQFIDDPILDLLSRAPTARTAAILLDQLNDPTPTADPERWVALIPLGRHLVEPWKVVIAGAPNVGKSSLMNALAGYARSIVSPIPGTTRDVVTMRIAIDGWPIEVTDTAGIRATSRALEQQGIDRAHDALSDADLRLWLLDGSVEPIFPEEMGGWHFVINKIDLPAAWDWQRVPMSLRLSAQTQAGLSDLCERISKTLVPAPPLPGEAVPL